MDDLEIRAGMVIPAAELRESFARSGGPGGQNVNKVASKVELRWAPATTVALGERDREWVLGKLKSRLTTDGELVITSSKSRDQLKNRDDARAKLADAVRRALERPKPRRKTRPSASAVARRLDEKRRRSDVKQARRRSDEE